jgi:recombination protein RecT
VLEKFRGVLGNEANAYVQSVLIACSANRDLMECEPESVFRSALRAASLELSCDPALKQAYLVPIKGKAEFWPHYRGLYTLATRTGKYTAINVTPVREGQQVFQHNVTGLHYLVIRDGLMVDNDRLSKLFAQGYHDVTNGQGQEKIIGYLGYYKTTRGFEKTIYMSIGEIAEHALKYAPGNYNNPKSDWNDPKHRPTMEMKTVLKELLRWADLSGRDNSLLRQAMAADSENPEWAADADVINAVAGPAPVSMDTKPSYTSEPMDEQVDEVEMQRPLTPPTLRSFLAARTRAIGIYQSTPEQLGLMTGMMDMVFAPDPDANKIRRSCIHYLFGYDSSKKLSGPQIKATLDWLKPVKDSGGAYSPDPMAAQELHAVWEAEQLAKGQTVMPGMEKK